MTQSGRADVIPAGDSGQFRITEQMMFESGAATMQAFDVLVREEAHRRSLDLEVLFELPSRDYIVRWWPAARVGKPPGA